MGRAREVSAAPHGFAVCSLCDGYSFIKIWAGNAHWRNIRFISRASASHAFLLTSKGKPGTRETTDVHVRFS